MRQLILCPDFDIYHLPLMIGNLHSDCNVVDIQNSGYVCEALQLEEFRILGQMEHSFSPESKSVHCIGVNKYGKLTFLVIEDKNA